MFRSDRAFSGFAVSDLSAAHAFYRDILGLPVRENEMGMLTLELAPGTEVLIYPKRDHEPAVFTILNLGVDDVEAAVDYLNSHGVVTKIYSDPDYGTDAKGISRGHGPDIAWFRDPSGNILSVLNDN